MSDDCQFGHRNPHAGDVLMARLRPAPLARSRHGFTLMELVLVIVVIGILGTAIAPVALSSFKANAAILGVVTMVDKQRYANDRLAFEIRELSSGTITTMTATTFAFSRVDYGGTTTTRIVTIGQVAPTFVTIGSTLVNQCNGMVTLNYSTPVISPAYVPALTDQICSLAFAYYDQTGLMTATPANVRYVGFTLTLKPNATGQEYAQQTRVALRNH
jgi:prepilin-type N-terminal cleavage/methylation domain-containing protein